MIRVGPTLLLLTGLAGCASRTAPAAHAEGAPASPRTRAAAPAQVTRALDGEPPVPGSDTSGWLGLRTSDDPGTHAHAGHDHDGHAGHAGHGAPVQQPGHAEHAGHAGHGAHAAPADHAGHAGHTDAGGRDAAVGGADGGAHKDHAQHGDHAQHRDHAPHEEPESADPASRHERQPAGGAARREPAHEGH